MDIRALADNMRRSSRLCPTWGDRVSYLASLYGNRLPVGFRRPQGRRITFDFGSDIGMVRLGIRDNRGADVFVLSEVFCHRNYDVCLPFVPETVLDLGANVGYASVFFARRYPRAAVACVEPEPDNLRLLHMNLNQNAVSAQVFAAAIAVTDGRLSIQRSEFDYGHKVADIPYGRACTGNCSDVEAVSIPTVLERLSWDRIGLLKIDIEGYEGILLREHAEWLHCVDAICIECHEGFSVEKLAEVTGRWGFAPPRRERGTLLLIRKETSPSRT